MRKTLEKMGSLVFSLLIFLRLANSFHEEAHNWVANYLEVDGYVKYTFWSAYFYYVDIPTHFQDVVIGLSGGLITAGLIGAFWYVTHRQLKYNRWELDDTVALGIVAITHFIYCFFDGFWRVQAVNGTGIALVIATAVSLIIYGKRILLWIGEE